MFFFISVITMFAVVLSVTQQDFFSEKFYVHFEKSLLPSHAHHNKNWQAPRYRPDILVLC